MTIQTPEQDAIHHLLAETVYTVVEQKLAESQPGHCLRISTLPDAVMRDLCARFNENGYQADVVLLAAPHQALEALWHVTSTRLIELRNTEEQPLLAFIPPGLRAAAEDSFDISTFLEIDFTTVQKICVIPAAVLPPECPH
jgi:predicted aconitase